MCKPGQSRMCRRSTYVYAASLTITDGDAMGSPEQDILLPEASHTAYDPGWPCELFTSGGVFVVRW